MARKKGTRSTAAKKATPAQPVAAAAIEAAETTPTTEAPAENPTTTEAAEAPATNPAAAETPAAAKTPAENKATGSSGSVTVLLPGKKRRSFAFTPGTTWSQLASQNKIALNPGWVALIGGEAISDNYLLKDGDEIKVGNRPRNG